MNNPWRYHPATPQRGMSLIEVLVALVLLAFGLFGIVDLYMNQMRSIGTTRHQAQAVALAQGYLLQLQEAGYKALGERIDINAEEGASDEAAHFPAGLTRSNLNPDFKWNARLRRVSSPQERKAIQIAVVVDWNPSVAVGGAEGPTAKSGVGKAIEVIGYVVAP